VTPCSRDLLQNLRVTQQVEKLPAFYEIRTFVTKFKEPASIPNPRSRSRHLVVIIFFPFNIIIPSTLGLPNGLFYHIFQHQNPVRIFSPPYMPHAPPIPYSLFCSPKQYLVKSTNHEASFQVIFSILPLVVPFRPTYIPQHHIQEYPQPMFFH